MPSSNFSFLFEQLRSSERGLSSAEAARRLAETGPNEPAPTERLSLFRQVLQPFSNPLVLMLLVASGLSIFLGEVLDAIIIILMVLLSAGLNFVQTFRSQKAEERLKAQVAPTATVLRDGEWKELPRRELVPGDIVRLVAGDMVPADAQLLEENELHVQQSSLTGESLPVEKDADDPVPSTDPTVARCTVFLGTSVVSGTATAIVVHTGPATLFGDIATRLAGRSPETEFERGLKKFGLFITRTVFFLVLFVFLVGALYKHRPLEALLFAVALAVGLIPEFLPMISSVTLAQGAVRMAKQKVIVKNLAAIQNFGSIDVLCSDKTGTLTRGDMVLERHAGPFDDKDDRVFLLAYLNSMHETGIKHPLNHAVLEQRHSNPLDEAILSHDHPDVRPWRKLDEIPFDFERRRLSVVVEKDGQRLLITKGAPENVLAQCTHYELHGEKQLLTPGARERCEATFQAYSRDGLRVLAVARREVPEQAVYRVADERELTLAGFLTFADPPLEDAREVLETLRRDGVEVKILTGDNELVARHVCEQVGLDGKRIVLGSDLERMTDTALAHIVEENRIFARVSPAQKNRIILALKSRSHVVGYMGDGINDAPSLHAADVGISVATGVDVARDAADIILLERSLRVLHSGILEGRKAFGNVMKYLLMGTSSNFGNMFSMAAASLFLPFLPMLPSQILLNNFLYDLAQVTIPTDRVDKSYVRSPKRWDMRIIRDFMVYIGPISSLFDFLTFFVLLKVLNAGEEMFHAGWFIESLSTQTLVLLVIRTAGNPLKSRPSKPLAITISLAVAAGFLLPYSPLAAPLGFAAPPAHFLLIVLGMIMVYLTLVELAKRRVVRRLGL